MTGASYEHTYRSVEAWIAESEARMRRHEQVADQIRLATWISWTLFAGCLGAGIGIIVLAATDGPIAVVAAFAAVVTLCTFALADGSTVWHMAGNRARRKADSGPDQD